MSKGADELSSRKPYEKPVLRDLGSIAELTQTGQISGNADGGTYPSGAS
jgi:hypothetical protein